MNRLMIGAILAMIPVGTAAQEPGTSDRTRPLLTPPRLTGRPQPRPAPGRGDGPNADPINYLFPAPVAPGAGGQHNVAADFNLDGFMDIAAAHSSPWGPNTVTLHYGRADGGFDEGEAYPFGTNNSNGPQCLAVGRFNNDDLPDLAVHHSIDGVSHVTLLLGQPSGGFAVGAPYDSLGGRSLVAGDFNADGYSDVITSYGSIRYGQGDGTLGPISGVGCVAGVTYPAVADFNGDDVDDLALGFGNHGAFTPTFACVLYGQPGLGLSAPQEYTVPGNPGYLAAGDFNGDGLDDLAAISFDAQGGGQDWLYIYYGQPTGGLGELQVYSGWSEWTSWGAVSFASARGMVATDLDGDGRDDLAVSYGWTWLSGAGWYHQSALMVLYGPQRGEWHPWRTTFTLGGGGWLGAPLSQRNHTAADMDGDHRGEILSNGGFIVDFDKTGGRLATRSDYIRIGDRFRGIAAADIDDDGALDLAVVDEDAQVLRILWGDGSGGFDVEQTTYPTEAPAIQVAAADLDSDGDLDLAVSSPTDRVRVFQQTAPREFATHVDYTVSGGTGIATADFDKQNGTDLAVGSTILYQQPGGTLGNPVQVDVGGDIVAADFDWDGWTDLAGRFGPQGLSLGVVFNQAGTAFTPPVGVELSSSPRAITVGDFNHDNWLDLAAWEGPASGNGDRMIDVLYAVPGGGFPGPVEQHGPYLTGHGDLASADFNRDGSDDLFAAMSMAVLLGQETGPLAEPRYYRAAMSSYDSAVADFNHDGRLDVATVGGGTVSVFLNQDKHKAVGDLEMVSMVGPVAGLAGQIVDVDWTVRNKLSTPLTAQWTDGVYLSRDETWDINDRLLGTLEFTGTLDPAGTPGGEYLRQVQVSLPAVIEASYYLLVRTDIYDDILEENGEHDNMASSPIGVEVPELVIGQTTYDEFAHVRQVKLYKVTVDPDEDLLITLDASSADGINELYIRYEYPATRVSYDAKYQNGFATDQTVRIPGTDDGTYYILAYADQLPSTGLADFSLHAEYLPFAATGSTPDRGGNTGRLSIDVTGSGFKPLTSMTLVYEGEQIVPLQTVVANTGHVAATFDLTETPPVVCDVVVELPGGEQVVLPSAFEIESGRPPELQLDVLGPGAIRPGGAPGSYEARVFNASNVDAEYVAVTAWVLPDDPEITLAMRFPGETGACGCGDSRFASWIVPRIPPGQVASVDYEVLVSGSYAGQPLEIVVEAKTITQEEFLGEVPQVAEDHRQRVLAIPNLQTIAPDLFALASNQEAWQTFVADALRARGYIVEELDWGDGGGGDGLWCNFVCNTIGGVVCWGFGYYGFVPSAGWSLLFALSCGQSVSSGCSGFCGPPPPPPPHNPCTAGTMGPNGSVISSRCANQPRPADPNDKLSLDGWGEEGFVPQEYRIPYTIRFENIPGATAAALKVDVADPLSPDLDWSTLVLSEIAFDEHVIEVPENLTHYQGRAEVDGWTWNEADGWHRYDSDGSAVMPLVVDIEAGIDIVTGEVHWSLICADPETGVFPADPYAGFLPPNHEDIFYRDPNDPDRLIHPGEGHVKFSVRPLAGLPTGTEITNVASIVFDWNATIDTPEVLNTIDTGTPSSQVAALPVETLCWAFEVAWIGEDDPGGSGVASYTIYVSDDGEPYLPWLTTEETTATFTGAQDGHTYAFYSVARDHVGHTEPPPTDPQGQIIPDATTTAVGALIGDFDCDGDVDFDDLTVLVDVLLGEDTTPTHVALADMNGDGAADGLDIQPFVEIMLAQ